MKLKIYNNIRSTFKVLITFGLGMYAQFVCADLPKMEDPSRGAGKGIIDTIKNYAYDGAILAGLLIACYAFIRVASSCISTYGEISDGRKKWGDLGMTALVGAILLVMIIWLLTKSAEIL